MIIQISGSGFHIQVWRLFCALCKLSRATVYAKGWCMKCAARRSDKCFFWKHGTRVRAYGVKQLMQHFLCIKEKKKKIIRPFLCNSMSNLYPDVYKLSTQVGSVFGYPVVQIESWQASWKPLPTLYIINRLKKNLYSTQNPFSFLLKKFILNNFLHGFLSTPKKVRKISHCSFGISWQCRRTN